MKTLTPKIQLDSSQFNALAEEAKKRQRSIDELLNDLLREYLDELLILHRRSETDFMSIVGLGKSGISDVSENHDKYLGEIIANEHLR
jgi:hypothetical protein